MTEVTQTKRTDVYQRVTTKIIEELERGVRPWHKPWNAAHAAGRITRPLRHNFTPYKGINILMLWAAAETSGYQCPVWLTFQQAKELGGHVRKAEKGSPVVYASTFKKTDTNEEGDEIEKEIPFLKQYTVFNVEQIDRLPEHFYQKASPTVGYLERIEHVEQFVANTKAKVRYGGKEAYYSLERDAIHMPPRESFDDMEGHAGILAHELTHWTRHPSRLNRDLGRKRFADAGYAMEELVAELGSAFLCADLKITPEVREDHACYIANWLTVLKNDKRAIFTAASHASRAVDYLHGLQPLTS